MELKRSKASGGGVKTSSQKRRAFRGQFQMSWWMSPPGGRAASAWGVGLIPFSAVPASPPIKFGIPCLGVFSTVLLPLWLHTATTLRDTLWSVRPSITLESPGLDKSRTCSFWLSKGLCDAPLHQLSPGSFLSISNLSCSAPKRFWRKSVPREFGNSL